MPVVNYDWDELEDNIIEEYDDDGSTVADYTTEPDRFGNVISQHRGGQSSFFHYDGHGSTLAITDDNEDVTDAQAYSAFGETTERTGSTVFPFQYVGERGYYRDSFDTQYIIRQRPYEPATSRWLSPDLPFISASHINTYCYSVNSPVVHIDPSGLLACDEEAEEKKEKKCAGACFIGTKSTITKCAFTKIKVKEGSAYFCYLITSAIMCNELKKQFEANNKAAEDLDKYPKGIWESNRCTEDCNCKKGYTLKKGPQKFELEDRTIESTGEIIGVGVITCIITLTGAVEVDGGGFALVECEKSQ